MSSKRFKLNIVWLSVQALLISLTIANSAAAIQPVLCKEALIGSSAQNETFVIHSDAVEFNDQTLQLFEAAKQTLVHNLGYQPRIYNSERVIAIYDPNSGANLGSISFESKAEALHIGTILVPKLRRGIGVSRFLLGLVLQSYPQTRIIYLDALSLDNLSVYRDFLGRGFSPSESMQQTPAYKIRSYFGFTKIQIQTSELGDVSFVVTKPKK